MLSIREARLDDLDAATALCQRAKASWGYSEAFLEACRGALTLTTERLASWSVHVAEDDAMLLGVVASVDHDAPMAAELELLFVEPSAMGRGVGTALLAHARDELAARGVETLWIDSDPGAEPFYLHQGAIRCTQTPSEVDRERLLPRLRLALGGPLPHLQTERLSLRPWREADRSPFAELNADPEVARHLPSTLTGEQSDAFAARIDEHFRRYRFGLWAAERTDHPDRPFIGFVGLSVPRFQASFMPAVEIGWRLAPAHWGLGLATEGARAAARFAFGSLNLDELVSFTVPANLASRRVMEKIGMRHSPGEDFDHPALPPGHRLCRHVLYRLTKGSP